MADPNVNSEISMDSDISDFDIEETHKKAATLKIQESTSEEIDADIEEPQTEPNQNEKKLGNKDELLIPRNDFAKDVAEMKSSIEKALSTLANLKQHPRRLPRKEYVERIASNAAELYSYSRELVDLFLGMFSPAECIRFLEANERARPVTIRANSIRTKRKELAKSLIERGVNLEPLEDWSRDGLRITESAVPIGATPEYLAGHYMLQSASSFVPVLALAPRKNERVADLCAAPGGKTTHIAALMGNSGSLVANDLKRDRLRALSANLHRMGVRNCTVTNLDGRKFPRHFRGFDRVLLDAPCSGLGVISRDQSVRARSVDDVRRCAVLQKELLLAAIDAVKVRGGVVVYSTCSVAVEENEAVVDYALGKRRVKLEPLGVAAGSAAFSSVGGKRFSPNMKKARRFFPHSHDMDGFFVAKLVKEEESDVGGKRVNEMDETDDLALLIDSAANKRKREKKKSAIKKNRRNH